LVVASPAAQFALPEALRGIYAGGGGLPRLIRNCGLQLASEIALTGRRLSAQELLNFHLINKISARPDTVVDEAIELARAITKNSPDAIVVTRAALREGWEAGSVDSAAALIHTAYWHTLSNGENAQEGLRAFAEKREPQWGPSKL
jgi:enoyl-CoA hydratase/carnithine racemase